MSMLKLELSPGVWRVMGTLTAEFIAGQYKKTMTKRPTTGDWCINCQEVEKIDSAGLAFLLDCARFARANRIQFTLEALPKTAFSLIEVQGLGDVFKTFYKEV